MGYWWLGTLKKVLVWCIRFFKFLVFWPRRGVIIWRDWNWDGDVRKELFWRASIIGRQMFGRIWTRCQIYAEMIVCGGACRGGQAKQWTLHIAPIQRLIRRLMRWVIILVKVLLPGGDVVVRPWSKLKRIAHMSQGRQRLKEGRRKPGRTRAPGHPREHGVGSFTE